MSVNNTHGDDPVECQEDWWTKTERDRIEIVTFIAEQKWIGITWVSLYEKNKASGVQLGFVDNENGRNQYNTFKEKFGHHKWLQLEFIK